ncbi:MaoC family dehydratase N-terminal domain-containing protein [Streptomyces sp. NPDC050738]|uniref:MaoC family dehydratase N-terminal domain-containing protein n=1 Tax=Streptomyces sp. NPDC050738 TaxID=3154744 RepID=UPI0034220186
MAVDPAIIGTTEPAHTVEVERGRLRAFAHATGQNDPVYSDLEAAGAAGHHDLPVPPTFLFCLEMENPDPFGFLGRLGIDPRTILHGGQRFEYHAQAFAGDALTFATEVTDVYTKKGGALEFIERATRVTRAGEQIATLTSTTVVRDPKAGRK